jgi:hypothetical protein
MHFINRALATFSRVRARLGSISAERKGRSKGSGTAGASRQAARSRAGSRHIHGHGLQQLADRSRLQLLIAPAGRQLAECLVPPCSPGVPAVPAAVLVALAVSVAWLLPYQLLPPVRTAPASVSWQLRLLLSLMVVLFAFS